MTYAVQNLPRIRFAKFVIAVPHGCSCLFVSSTNHFWRFAQEIVQNLDLVDAWIRNEVRFKLTQPLVTQVCHIRNVPERHVARQQKVSGFFE